MTQQQAAKRPARGRKNYDHHWFREHPDETHQSSWGSYVWLTCLLCRTQSQLWLTRREPGGGPNFRFDVTEAEIVAHQHWRPCLTIHLADEPWLHYKVKTRARCGYTTNWQLPQDHLKERTLSRLIIPNTSLKPEGNRKFWEVNCPDCLLLTEEEKLRIEQAEAEREEERAAWR